MVAEIPMGEGGGGVISPIAPIETLAIGKYIMVACFLYIIAIASHKVDSTEF